MHCALAFFFQYICIIIVYLSISTFLALARRPELPTEQGPGRGGRIGSNVSQHILKNLIQDRSRDEDPREALLKYAKIAEEEPLFVAPAYAKTQPKPIFSKNPLDVSDEESKKK